jgi:hypothetical protein
MRTRKRSVVKRSYYIPPDRAQGFKEFANDGASADIEYAMVAWLALPGESRDGIARLTPNLPLSDAVRLARRLIEQGTVEQAVLRRVEALGIVKVRKVR